MKKLLAIFITVVLFLPLAFGQSEEESIFKLWKADDPRTANPRNRYQPNNPLNPVNKYRWDNDYNPVNRFKFDNPLNPVNKYNPNNMLNRTNRFNIDSPLNPINRYRSPSNPPKKGMFKRRPLYKPKSYTPRYELPGLLDNLWEDDPY